MNASSLTRFSNTSSSAERLIRMVRAFLAMGYMSKQEHISKQFFFFFFFPFGVLPCNREPRASSLGLVEVDGV